MEMQSLMFTPKSRRFRWWPEGQADSRHGQFPSVLSASGPEPTVLDLCFHNRLEPEASCPGSSPCSWPSWTTVALGDPKSLSAERLSEMTPDRGTSPAVLRRRRCTPSTGAWVPPPVKCYISLIVSFVAVACAQLHLTLCNSKDCSPPGSSVPGIFQVRILVWVAVPSSRGSSWPRDGTCVYGVSCIGSRFLTACATVFSTNSPQAMAKSQFSQ